MDQILINFKNLEWWFTGLFFATVTLIIKMLVKTWLPYLWNLLVQIMPQLKIRFQRWEKRRTLIIIQRHRQHVVKVNSLISRYWSLAAVFTLAVFYQLFSYPSTNDFAEKQNEVMQLIAFVAPVYFLYLFLYLWLMWEQHVLNAVIKAHIKWQKHITSKIGN